MWSTSLTRSRRPAGRLLALLAAVSIVAGGLLPAWHVHDAPREPGITDVADPYGSSPHSDLGCFICKTLGKAAPAPPGHVSPAAPQPVRAVQPEIETSPTATALDRPGARAPPALI